jgi:hypothetical protein
MFSNILGYISTPKDRKAISENKVYDMKQNIKAKNTALIPLEKVFFLIDEKIG